MAEERSSERPHRRHLEQARAQVAELLSRQEVERSLVDRSPQRRPEVVSQLLGRQQQATLEQRLAALHPADIAYVLEGLPPHWRQRAWNLVRPARRGAVLLEASDVVRRALIQELSPDQIASLVQPLSAEDIADLLSSLDEERSQEVLAQLRQAEQVEVRSVLSFPEGSVGAAMVRDIVVAHEHATLQAVQRSLQRRKELPPHTNQLFVVDQQNRLRGLLPIAKLVLGQPDTVVRDGMNTDIVAFHTDDPMRDAISAFEKYDLVSAPVLNLHGQIVGRLTVDAVVDEINERAQTEVLRQVGLSRDDEDLYVPVRRAAARRWPWLALNVCTAVVASRVIGAFEPLIAQLSALAALMPIVASIGGNAGNQSVALTVQGFSLKETGRRELLRLLLREVSIAAINGLVWGLLLGMLAWLIYRDAALSGVLALALLLNLLVAATVGVLAPALLRRLGRDPMMGASIVLTASTDSLGFLLFLGLAALLLG
jgi:magnesium transporter